MATRREHEARVAGATKDELKTACRAENVSGFSTLAVDDLRKLVVESRLRAHAEAALDAPRTAASSAAATTALKELRLDTLKELCRARRLPLALSAANMGACIDALLAGAPAVVAAPAAATQRPPPPAARPAAPAAASQRPPPPAAGPSAPGPDDLVANYKLTMLPLSALNSLAAALHVAPADGAAAFSNKTLAVAALAKRVLQRHLPPDSRALIEAGCRERELAAAAAAAAPAGSSGGGALAGGAPRAAPPQIAAAAGAAMPAAAVHVTVSVALPHAAAAARSAAAPPAPAGPPAKTLPASRLQLLSLPQLEALAAAGRGGSVGGSAAFATKKQAVAALAGVALERDLSDDMRAVIRAAVATATDARKKRAAAAAAAGGSSSAVAAASHDAMDIGDSGDDEDPAVDSSSAPAAKRARVIDIAPAPAPGAVVAQLIVAPQHLQCLAHLHLTELSHVVGVLPQGDKWHMGEGQASKNAAVRALTGRVPARLLTGQMKGFIKNGTGFVY